MPEFLTQVSPVTLDQFDIVANSKLSDLPIARSMADAFTEVTDPRSLKIVESPPDGSVEGTPNPPYLYVIGKPNLAELEHVSIRLW